ncbi:MAG: hypothetical protein JNM39_10395 [Bdellovibrionaceae bacterium]|nr:hypothetical protein [Pseudobdellovibrionaceae bacterium]
MIKKFGFTMLLVSGIFSAGIAGPNHSMDQIDVCYHWLEGRQLQAKVDFAKSNNGAFYFHQRKPVYCWKSPLGAYSSWESHGNELLRIKLKPGIRVVEQPRSASIDDMRDTPVVYSREHAWHEYLLAPDAIESWSIYQSNMVTEMRAELAYYELGNVTSNDIFYPRQYFDLNYLRGQIPSIIESHSQNAQSGGGAIFGTNLADHFKSKYKLPWQSMLQVNGNGVYSVRSTPATVEILKASYGIDLNRSESLINVTAKAQAFCQGKTVCNYKVSPKFVGDPAPNQDKEFELVWKCSDAAKARPPVKIAAPADDNVIRISCL